MNTEYWRSNCFDEAKVQYVRCVSGCPYLIRDASMVVVPHTDPDWTLDLIRRRPRCLVALPVWTHLHILMDDTYNTDTNGLLVSGLALYFHPTRVFGLFLFCLITLFLFYFLLSLHLSVHIPIRRHDLLSFLDFIYSSRNAMVGSQSRDDGLYHPHCRGVSQVCIKYHW